MNVFLLIMKISRCLLMIRRIVYRIGTPVKSHPDGNTPMPVAHRGTYSDPMSHPSDNVGKHYVQRLLKNKRVK